ncbi:ras-related C3 botulinum toxin substrate 1-like [Stegodyphus dumicola]|uniref:ras-related C3 botulinum toxin substrate 1-like n=1 Tax=Stegodyphus dumicola TaxID=202533 RepID=UPI0015AD9841|nr:ras-related C3 botulinum toxin substrate 1-like [Stegodyphus dumicola]XP_035231555.1 ras-related C3 botulinum toxin substrate 1-like [Stegodyphus dumicola]XP_035231556.1 ras-related C3 botulinum toxin substrate 1-like [Stegodyphus dumicola]
MRKRFPPRNLKLTVVGDKRVGKTSLLKTYTHGVFPQGEYVSTVFPYLSDEDYVYSKPINYSGHPVLLTMWDRVYNQKEDDLIRSLQYDQTDIFLLCFSVTDRTSFLNATTLWKPEIQKHCPKSPCILVGLKKDLRCSRSFSRHEVVTKSMGRDMAEKIGAVAYMECSARKKEGVKEIFAVAVQTAMRSPPPKPKKKSGICGSRLLRFIKLL